MAPSFAEIKAKATKVKDAGVEKVQKTRDNHSSVPLAKTNWDPYSKKPPPPPPPPKINASSRPAGNPFPPPPPTHNRPSAAPLPPPPSRGSQTASQSPPPALPIRSSIQTPPLPTRPLTQAPPLPSRSPVPAPYASPSRGPPPIAYSTRPNVPSSSSQVTSQGDFEIDWTNLSPKDKEIFFRWLDEFFEKYLGIVIPQRA